jgi:hypothetical protein
MKFVTGYRSNSKAEQDERLLKEAFRESNNPNRTAARNTRTANGEST